jgi:photosystem II stability/assembly factor-like uncharacterized protein
MRTTRTFFLAIALMLSFTVSAQWVQQNTPKMNGLYKMHAFGKNAMWMVNQNLGGLDTAHLPQLLRTGDGGKTFKVTSLFPKDDYFYVINAQDAKTALLLAGHHTEPIFIFRRTVDSGATWRDMSYKPTTFPDFAHFYDANNGILVCDPDSLGHNIVYTTNGGTTFTRLPQVNLPRALASEFPVQDQYQIMGNTLFIANVDVANGMWRIMRSLDQGRNWTAGEWFSTEDIFETRFVFTDNNNGMVLRGIGTTTQTPLYTTDGGKTWQESGKLPGRISYPLSSLPNTENLVAIFEDTVRHVAFTAVTNDFGKTWHSRKDVGPAVLDTRYADLGQASYINGQLEIVDNNTAWAQFSNTAIHRYESSTPIVTEKPDLELSLSADKDGLPLWNYVKFTLTIKNRGISRATGIKANWLPPYKRSDNGGEPFANVGAYSSKGNYNWWTGDWNISELAAGESATATFHLFVVKNNANVTQTAQITACNESDLDSAPNNMVGTTPKEDDETSFTSVRATAFGEPVPNSTPPLFSLKISPNPAKDKAFVVLNDKNDAAWDVEVVNSLGQVVFSKKEQRNGLLELNTEGYKNGLYLVHLTNGIEKRIEKLMVQH